MAYVWLGKYMTKSGIRGYHVLLTGAKKIPTGDTEKIQQREIFALKLLYFKAYNKLIIAQEDTAYFQIFEEMKTTYNKYRYTRLAWKKIS